MVDDELVRQMRDVAGTEIVTCDVCGRPVVRGAITVVAGKPEVAEPVEELLVCPECFAAMEQGEVDLTPSPDEETTPGGMP